MQFLKLICLAATVFVSQASFAQYIYPIVGQWQKPVDGYPDAGLSATFRLTQEPTTVKITDPQTGEEKTILASGQIVLDYYILFLDDNDHSKVAPVGHGFGFFSPDQNNVIEVPEGISAQAAFFNAAKKTMVCEFFDWAKSLSDVHDTLAGVAEIVKGQVISQETLTPETYGSVCAK